MFGFLRIIEESNLQRAYILAIGEGKYRNETQNEEDPKDVAIEGRNPSWIQCLWKSSKEKLKYQYRMSNYQIQLEYNVGFSSLYHGFVIDKQYQ